LGQLSAAAPEFPWAFPYIEDKPNFGFYQEGEPVLRPAAEIQLLGPAVTPDTAPRVAALIDSGSERTIAAPWLARAIGVEPDPSSEITVSIGQRPRKVRFADAMLRISPFAADPFESHYEWQAYIGFFDHWEPTWGLLLGQRGFFEEFSVTMSRYTQMMVLEPYDAMEQRFASQISAAERRVVDGL
jgi:hypothetical protein